MSRSHRDDLQFVDACEPKGKQEGSKVLKHTFLAYWLTRHCLSSSRRRSASAATCSGVASPNQRRKLTNVGTTGTLGKILKDQKMCRGKKEIPIQKLPVTGLVLPPLGALHGLYCLSHKLGDGPRLIVLPYVKLEIAGHSSLFSRRLPKGVPHMSTLVPVRNISQPDSRRTKRKSYFQCFTFDFFSIAVMKAGLLLKQYHPKSPVSLGALWTVCTRLNARAEQRKSETVVKNCVINSYTFRGRLIYGGVCLGDNEGIPGRQKGRPLGRGSDCPDHPAGPSGCTAFSLKHRLVEADGPSGDEELDDAPSEDELLNELSEEELEEASPEVELVLVEANSAPGISLCTLGQQLVKRPNTGGRLGLRHSSNLKISHIISYGDPPGIGHLHLWTEDTRGGGVPTVGP
ncbi:hypothetical protein Cgig2_020626 [Carnegiea gigantea]|uniref:Uncharacterized protein n=1 Tax=Carnegiea gigantea TaxID=171969 RepID=A0A9Q1JY40_9CARY|nr:hypothetical protein Cgig2_020626 [Carnegiea gigantea]